MRKIETQIVNAIKENKDLKIANSEVISCSNVSDVYLHGNLIARIGETWMELFDCGYQTTTTKSRLNALLSAFGMEGEYIFQKKGQWFINYQGAPIPFFNGMRLAWSLSSLGPSNCLYSMNNTSMTQVEINGAISQAFANLSILNEQVYDYWVSELYTLDGAMIDEMWNEQTVYEMETDVMQNSWELQWLGIYKSTT